MASLAKKFRYDSDHHRDHSCFKKECEFEAESAFILYKHYRLYHSKARHFHSPCLHSNSCFHTKEFLSFGSLRNHLNRYHSSFFNARPHSGEGPCQLMESVMDISAQDKNNAVPGMLLIFFLMAYSCNVLHSLQDSM